MNNVLEAMKLHTDCFIQTSKHRMETSTSNKELHHAMILYLQTQDWECVESLLRDNWYKKPLEGVIFTLHRFSGIPDNIQSNIVDLYNENLLY